MMRKLMISAAAVGLVAAVAGCSSSTSTPRFGYVGPDSYRYWGGQEFYAYQEGYASGNQPIADYSKVFIKPCTRQTRLVEDGPAGPRGRVGLAGPPGPAGGGGVIGPAGPAGPAGAPGPQGRPGMTGVPGPRGPEGMSGKKGAALDSVHFEFQTARLLSDCQTKIPLIAAWAQRHPSADLEIEGYLDQREANNVYSWNGTAFAARTSALSDLRARLVRDALVAAGLPEGRIWIGGGDTSRFLCSEGSEKCWQQNRRVEIATIERAAL